MPGQSPRILDAASQATPQRDPIRTCVGCGRTAPQRELVRFTAERGRLVHGARHPGRGAYTCRRVECFEAARARHRFSRVLRTSVRVDPALAALYTGDSNG
jgi:predicted RNA-binding protein YlxR (DUF448 family)